MNSCFRIGVLGEKSGNDFCMGTIISTTDNGHFQMPVSSERSIESNAYRWIFLVTG